MTFQEGGSFEGGRVGTRRGVGGKGIAIGGGGIGAVLVTLLVMFIANQTGTDPNQLLNPGGVGGGAAQEDVVGDCTVEQANTDRQCRLSATIQSLDAVWAGTLTGADAGQPAVWSFEGSTSTGCGNATSAVGPFYCPTDQSIYLDLGFFDQLTSQLGATGGPLAEEYVVAHEYGHHIQQVTGVMDRANRGGTGAESDSVRVELQADCYAGVWAGNAATTVDPDTGVTFLEPITQDELATALDAASAVGDDRIQAGSGGGVNPETWTHGSSAQRQKWFMVGYDAKKAAACDTFGTDDL